MTWERVQLDPKAWVLGRIRARSPLRVAGHRRLLVQTVFPRCNVPVRSYRIIRFWSKLTAISAPLVVSACQAAQVTNANTAAADAVEPIYRDQVLSNLSRLIDEPNAIPSQVKLVTGTNQASGTFTPSVTFPLSSMFARTVSATPTQVTSTAGAGSTLSGSLGYQLTYNTTPTTEIIDLQNLRAIYMAVLCSGKGTRAAIDDVCASFSLREAYTPPRIYDSADKLVFDGYYLEPPLCILCLNPQTIKSAPNTAFVDIDRRALDIVNVLNPESKWLYWLDLGSIEEPQGTVFIGQSGGRRFYAQSYQKFADFVLKTLPLPASPSRPIAAAVSLSVPSPPVPAPAPIVPPVARPAPVPAPRAPQPAPAPVQVPLQIVPGSTEGGTARPLFVPQVLPPFQ